MTICKKCQNLFFSGKNKKDISKCLLKFLPRVLSVETNHCHGNNKSKQPRGIKPTNLAAVHPRNILFKSNVYFHYREEIILILAHYKSMTNRCCHGSQTTGKTNKCKFGTNQATCLHYFYIKTISCF